MVWSLDCLSKHKKSSTERYKDHGVHRGRTSVRCSFLPSVVLYGDGDGVSDGKESSVLLFCVVRCGECCFSEEIGRVQLVPLTGSR